MIKLMLTGLLLVGLLFAIREWKRSSILCLAIMLPTCIGIYLVWQPQASTAIANALGVGRGADLLLYVYVALSFVLLISLLLRIKSLHEQLTELARAIAIANPLAAGKRSPDSSIANADTGRLR